MDRLSLSVTTAVYLVVEVAPGDAAADPAGEADAAVDTVAAGLNEGETTGEGDAVGLRVISRVVAGVGVVVLGRHAAKDITTSITTATTIRIFLLIIRFFASF